MKLEGFVQSGDIIQTLDDKIGIVIDIKSLNSTVVIYANGGFDYLDNFDRDGENCPSWIIKKIKTPTTEAGCSFLFSNPYTQVTYEKLNFSLEELVVGDLIKCRNGLYGTVINRKDCSLAVVFEDMSIKCYSNKDLTYYGLKDYDIVGVYRTNCISSTKEEKLQHRIWFR